MDDIDQAQGYNEDFQAFCLHEQICKGGFETRPYYTGTDCIECGDEIPEARRMAQPGCCRCVSCQTEFELHTNWRPL